MINKEKGQTFLTNEFQVIHEESFPSTKWNLILSLHSNVG